MRSLSTTAAKVWSAAYSPDGKFIITASGDQTARIWEAATGQEVLTLSGHTDNVYSAAYSPDGQFVVTASGRLTTRIWDAATGQSCINSAGSHRAGLFGGLQSRRHVKSSPPVGTRPPIWDAATEPGARQIAGPPTGYQSAAYSPDGQFIVTAGTDLTARIWD
ncbi:MAG: hypothetical protein IPH87_12645, partial [Anaerolineae bacterium]|nr:hypothetical protein [Anaerolineae bacterium]